MNALILTLSIVATLLAVVAALPSGKNDAKVEIEKQRLVRFPDDVDQHRNVDSTDTKEDEAKRILEEINKINKALGYVKKQPESSKLPPILDSSQYLFPKPAYHPFHSQTHQIAGSNGETILVPSIRAVKFDDNRYMEFSEAPRKTHTKARKQQLQQQPQQQQQQQQQQNINKQKLQIMTLNEYQDYLQHNQPQAQAQAQTDTQFYYRPNQVYVATPENSKEQQQPQQQQQQHQHHHHQHHQQQQLPTHFMIPVRLYKLNKEEYTKKYAPQEYRIKGYKIVGDIDNFYRRTKSKSKANKNSNNNSHKSSSKYHLFFLPRELAINELRPATTTHAKHTKVEAIAKTEEHNASREEKVRPLRVQPAGSSSSSSGSSSSNTQTALAANTTTNTQTVRKRIVAKPSLKTTAASNVKITPPPTTIASSTSQPTKESAGNVANAPASNKFSSLFNRPQVENLPNKTASNAIKTAFQNIFKFPFRQEVKPDANTDGQLTNLEPVPLQLPQKTFFNAQSLIAPSSFFQPAPVKKETNPGNTDNDYKWAEETNSNSNSNSAADDDYSGDSPEQSEKQLFGHFHAQNQLTQKEALRQGGIIIQKLKVRKGGIAIAGPGGVATAGSGGTAIVGPGGYALTHPRSLTIAGPGAKVIAIPPNVDLKDALQRTNLSEQSFPREGKIVATGPTVYYAPAATTGTAEEIEQFSWQTANLPNGATLFVYNNHNTFANTKITPPQPQQQQQQQLTQYILPSYGSYYLQYIPQPFAQTYYAAPTFALPTVNSIASDSGSVSKTINNNRKTTTRKPSTPTTTATTTFRPNRKNTEPTTARPEQAFPVETGKLRLQPAALAADFRSDAQLLAGVQQINSNYIIEDIIPVPGQLVLRTTNYEKLQPAQPVLAATKSLPTKAIPQTANAKLTVEATGKTATMGNIPQIPFGTYFLPYLQQQQQTTATKQTAALILEPHSKAVVGNGGTAISTPISKAYLRKGVPTNVYFNPDSVAIAGVGGKAHAQADLELNLYT